MLGIAAVMSHIIWRVCHCMGRVVEVTNLLRSHLNHIRWTNGTGINHRPSYNTLAMRSRNCSYNNKYTLANSVVYLDKLEVIISKQNCVWKIFMIKRKRKKANWPIWNVSNMATKWLCEKEWWLSVTKPCWGHSLFLTPT